MGGGIIFLAAVSAGLQVTTGSPDALCPPLELAQETIAARVGEVQGGSYVADYTVVRDAEHGTKLLHLQLKNELGEVVLDREIPLGQDGCAIAAQTMALILESHFDGLVDADQAAPSALVPLGLEATAPPEARPTENVEQSRTTELSSGEAASESSKVNAGATPGANGQPRTSHPRLGFRLGAGVTDSGTFAFSGGTLLQFLQLWSLGVDIVVPVTTETKVFDYYRLEHQRIDGYLEALIHAPWTRWSAGVGPILGAHFETAHIDGTPVLNEGRRTRWLGSLGMGAQIGYRLSPHLFVDLTGRAAAQLIGPEFVVDDLDDRQRNPLALPSLASDFAIAIRYMAD